MDTIFKNNAYRIIELFMLKDKEYSLRGIGRALGVSHATAIKYIKEIEKLGLVRKKESIYPTYIGTDKLRYYKQEHMVFSLRELTSYLKTKTLASSIVLFGSCARGDYNQDSDVDIFVESEEVSLELKVFEKKIGRKINVLFEPKINDLSQELKNNILNGQVLYGFIRI